MPPSSTSAAAKPLAFNDEEVKKLREFAEDGGLILGNADCVSPGFSKSFIESGRQAVPQVRVPRTAPQPPHLHRRELQARSSGRTKPRLTGLSNGVRELMLLVPDADPSKELAGPLRRHPALDIYQFGFDIFQYTGGSLNFTATRPDPYIVHARPQASRCRKTARSSSSGWPSMKTPTPSRAAGDGWPTSSTTRPRSTSCSSRPSSATASSKAPRSPTSPAPPASSSTPRRRRSCEDFVDDGGTLIVDAAGGSTDFADSAEKALAAIFGGRPGDFGAILPPTTHVYRLNGAKIEQFDYRRYCRGKLNGHLNVPRIRGLEEGDRIQVFYSSEDLSAGLVGQPTDGILGYDSDTATNLMRNMVLYLRASATKPWSPPPVRESDGIGPAASG